MYIHVLVYHAAEPLIKDTSEQRTLSDAPTYIVAIHFTSEIGKLLYNGQNDPNPLFRDSHCTETTMGSDMPAIPGQWLFHAC